MRTPARPHASGSALGVQPRYDPARFFLGVGFGGFFRPCDIYQRPEALDLDYGVPTGLCKETAAGVFEREWSKSTVTVNCNAYTSAVHFTEP